MNQGLRKVLVLTAIFPTHGWSQAPPLPYRSCNPPAVFIAETDTVRQRAVIVSTVSLVTGRWQLVEEEAGACFGVAHAPLRYTELAIDQQGKATVYRAGLSATTCQLQFSFVHGRVHFVMHEASPTPYFNFLPPYRSKNRRTHDPNFEGSYPNVLRACPETLMLTGPRTGLSYVFKRLPTYGPAE